ncbi:unnamed protein product [marine sediment metagenome]|uniref:Uncharacterized protein n=1 Tax=marine sediment metagenome TaxID=412755 RepID=X1K0X9_9ZZZZ
MTFEKWGKYKPGNNQMTIPQLVLAIYADWKADRKKAEARIAELEQELLWAVDACEKAETEVEGLLTDNAHKDHDLFQTEKRVKELERYNKVLTDQRADVYKEGEC